MGSSFDLPTPGIDRTPPTEHDESFCSHLMKKFWEPPVLRQIWGVKQKVDKVTWFELFYDLIYVGLAINLSTFLKKKNDLEGILVTFLYFSVLFYMWQSLNILSTRFNTKDIFSTCVYFSYSLSVLAISIYCLDGLKRKQEVSWAQVAAKIALSLIYLQIRFQVPRAREFAKYAVTGNALSACVFVGAAFTPSKLWASMLWLFGGYVVEFVWIHFSYSDPRASIPLNIEHTTERFGLFIMLVLGESIVAIVTDANGLTGVNDWLIAIFGFATVFACKTIYFEAQPHEPKEHALKRSSFTGRLYVYLHIPLGTALIGVGTGIKLLKSHANKKPVVKFDYFLFSYSLVLFLIMANAFRLIHSFESRNKMIWIFRIISVSILGILPGLVPDPPASSPTVVVFYCVWTCALALVDVIATKEEEEDEGMTLNTAPLPKKETKIRNLMNSKIAAFRTPSNQLQPPSFKSRRRTVDSTEFRVLQRAERMKRLDSVAMI